MKRNIKGSPMFNEIDSTPIEQANEFQLKLCFCPLCTFGPTAFGKEDSRGIISWQYICRVILFSLTVKEHPKQYFSLKGDMLWFIVDHWFLFGKLKQFRTNPNKWKKAFLDALSHSSFFESGSNVLKKTGYWKLTNISTPWNDRINYFETQTIPTFTLPQCNSLETSNSQNTISVESKMKIKQHCLDAKKNFEKALMSLQLMNENAEKEDVMLVHQLKEVQTLIGKTDKIVYSLE